MFINKSQQIKRRFLLVSIILLVSTVLFPQEIKILTEDSGPANYLDGEGKLIGFSTEVVREILRRLGEADKIEVYPWARAYKLLEEQADVALFSTTRTTEREEQFKWVGPLMMIEWALYKRQDSDLTLDSLEEAKRVKGIVVVKNDAKEKFLIESGFSNFFSANSALSSIRMLQNRRVDFWLTSNRGILATSEQAGLEPDLFTKALSIKKVYLYIAFSKKTSNEVVEKWQAVLDEMKRDGTYEIIMRENGGENAMALFPPL